MSKLSELIAKLCPNGVESGSSSASDSRISRTTRTSSRIREGTIYEQVK